jgi:protein CpxP
MTQNNPTIRRFLMTSAVALCVPLTSFAQEASAPADNAPPAMGRHDGMRHARGGEHHSGMLNPGLLRRLDLTPAQRDQMKQLFAAGKDARRKQQEEMMASHKALHDLIVSGQYSEARAKELASTIAAQESTRILAMAEQGNKMFQILTPAQRAKLAETPADKPARKG